MKCKYKYSRGRGGASRVIPCDEEEDTDTVHELVHCNREHCRMCGVGTLWQCACTPQSGTASGNKRNDASAMFL